VQYGFEQAAAVGLGGRQFGFRLVAEGHRLIDRGDDAVLLGERWDGNRHAMTDLSRQGPELNFDSKRCNLTVDRLVTPGEPLEGTA